MTDAIPVIVPKTESEQPCPNHIYGFTSASASRCASALAVNTSDKVAVSCANAISGIPNVSMTANPNNATNRITLKDANVLRVLSCLPWFPPF